MVVSALSEETIQNYGNQYPIKRLGILNIVRRAVPKFQRLEPEELSFFTWLVKEILDEQIPEREVRSNPRVVRKTRAKSASKKPIHKGAGVKLQPLIFSVLNTA